MMDNTGKRCRDQRASDLIFKLLVGPRLMQSITLPPNHSESFYHTRIVGRVLYIPCHSSDHPNRHLQLTTVMTVLFTPDSPLDNLLLSFTSQTQCACYFAPLLNISPTYFMTLFSDLVTGAARYEKHHGCFTLHPAATEDALVWRCQQHQGLYI